MVGDKFFRKLSIRVKLNAIFALIFIGVIAIATFFGVERERSYMLQVAEEQVTDLTTWYFDSLNTMMLTGTMDQRSILRGKLLARPQVLEARVVRGNPVRNQFGPGLPEEAPFDDLDYQALAGKVIKQVEQGESGRVLTVLTPFHATENTRGVNCLRCHEVQSGAVNGAVRVTYSLAHMDAAVARETWFNISANAVLAVLGLLFLNILIHKWMTRPINNLMDAVKRRADGDTAVRAKVESCDELGRLSDEFNVMADNIDNVTNRELRNALELQNKVDVLLTTVNRVTEGDLSAKITFSGDDSIGELSKHLQIMIDNLRINIEEKRVAVELLQRKVDSILSVVTKVASGDLTEKIVLPGNDAIAHLSAGVQSMMESLNTLVAQIQRSGVLVTSSATEISATMAQVEGTALKQAATTNQIASTATEITATARELVNTMGEVAAIADKATRSAFDSHEGLSRMETLIEQVVDSASVVAGKLEILNEKAANINSVVTTITSVADQTNLLSLNASIEAEKAGDYGRGFAVVAAEIRRLADQAAVASLDIEYMIKEMQASVVTGVQSMARFTTQVQSGVENIQTVSKQQSEIINLVETLGPLFETVHKGMHFQSAGAEQINDAMLHLNDDAQQTVSSLSVASAAITRLNVSAQGLQNSVSKFKVSRKKESE